MHLVTALDRNAGVERAGAPTLARPNDTYSLACPTSRLSSRTDRSHGPTAARSLALYNDLVDPEVQRLLSSYILSNCGRSTLFFESVVRNRSLGSFVI